VLGPGSGARKQQITDLQRDLRKLGYLATGIDGVFGVMTGNAVRALQHDLLHNSGRGSDGDAPVRLTDYNRGRVTSPDGLVDEKVAAAIEEMLEDERFAKVPESPDPVAANREVVRQVEEVPSGRVPMPFLAGILSQESGLRHYSEPTATNADSFVVVGLDRNAPGSPAVTSRGYGIGQYTLFHHPPSPQEMDDFVLDPRANVQKAIGELQDKFLHFVNGNTAGTRADDRRAEYGRGPLRLCKYAADDPRYMSDCRRCLAAAGTTEIRAGVTSLYPGAGRRYEPTQYHAKTEYTGVPVRAAIGCDWPYAVRRYNGSGMNSYHYQTQVLLRVLNG